MEWLIGLAILGLVVYAPFWFWGKVRTYGALEDRARSIVLCELEDDDSINIIDFRNATARRTTIQHRGPPETMHLAVRRAKTGVWQWRPTATKAEWVDIPEVWQTRVETGYQRYLLHG